MPVERYFMRTTLRKFGNSQGVIIPKALLSQFGLSHEVEMTVTQEGIMLRNPQNPPRQGWVDASQTLAKNSDNHLVWPDFANKNDETTLNW